MSAPTQILQVSLLLQKPLESKQGNTSSWSISIIKEANQPKLPRQKIHIDVCAIPSFDPEKRPLINHYDIVVHDEIRRFIPLHLQQRTIEHPDYWEYVQTEINTITANLIDPKPKKIFDMGTS